METKIAPETLELIKSDVKTIFENSRGSHDLDHTHRVYNLCLRIGHIEHANKEVITLAALLHDIGRQKQDSSQGKVCHARYGSVLAEKVLMKYDFPDDFIKKITHCIETHRFRNNKPPVSLEAKVLFDADKLDAIGAVGIGRAFLFAGEIGAKLHNQNGEITQTQEYSIEDTAYREYMVKLRYIKDKMLTDEGKRLAQGRHQFMVEFFDRLDQECNGLS
ncbi:MAG TPA: phosphohydrolase [Candidatus Margulisbacteria bacterium]|nr:MAG: hypothetical protein A2X43_02245 [Candidatus Margulisbacteria bacterium GWD2_39_127]OGI00895.1 MAG: hypothetical protein A2X42_03120 [Candidatus Margulisbacteria bacterium GWF2_38_17]OGI08750.1 MAG: hypothetical protein A2X41_05375 [Candidatus Margulisbacteria bacterium GWE2_39_32]HAR63485.1 phosphohydrolase [Candidatus Margulisiibacteriota bacterium]HCT86063.1 phosphohydrolase [Candidatus Margulisiibacteriota bacterium]